MANIPPIPQGQMDMGAPTLDAFLNAASSAENDGELRVAIDGEKFLVLAKGRTANGREVAWIANTEPDATSIYLEVFRRHFGARITEAVVGQLNGELVPGKPLFARTVTLALEMADRSLTALSGVDFLTRLHSSAIARGRNFDDTCLRMGLDAKQINDEVRASIDAEIQKRFQQALTIGESPVAFTTLQGWLEESMRKLKLTP